MLYISSFTYMYAIHNSHDITKVRHDAKKFVINQKHVMSSKKRHDIKKRYSWLQQHVMIQIFYHDIKNYVTTSSNTKLMLKVCHDVKNKWRQKSLSWHQNTLWRHDVYINTLFMTSKTRHVVKKFVITSKLFHDAKSSSSRQKTSCRQKVCYASWC